MVIEEEEVPRGGATLERRWQTARWTDGSLHVWLQRTKRLGHGERSSGLRWDSLEDLPDPDGRPDPPSGEDRVTALEEDPVSV